MDHLEQAKMFVAMGTAAADRCARTHALIDIAESLHALRPPTPAPNAAWRFGDRVVHLAELPLEVVGGCDDEAAS